MNTPEIPDRMKRFPLWQGRFPIFFTVLVEKGIPFFKEVSRPRQVEASVKRLCHLCGQKLWLGGMGPTIFWFLIHDSEVADRATTDGPMHEECARYATQACPYLSNLAYDSKGGIRKPNLYHLEIGTNLAKPLIRDRMALASAMDYTVDLSRQYPLFMVPEWRTVDWDCMPQPTEEQMRLARQEQRAKLTNTGKE